MRDGASLRIVRPGDNDLVADLPRRTIVNLDGPMRGATIGCRAGALWITQAGDSRDYVLAAGDEFAPGRDGQVVVEVLKDARVSVRRAGLTAGELRFSLSSGRRAARFAASAGWRSCLEKGGIAW